MASFHQRRILSKMETRWERSVFRERWKQRKNDGGANPRLRILYSNRCLRELFDSGIQSIAHSAGEYKKYAVSPDGQRFLIPRPALATGDTAPPITVVVNWTTGLRK